MTIDVLASERHFVDHLAPIWHALPDISRGMFLVPRTLLEHAQLRAIAARPIEPTASAAPILVSSYGDQKRARAMGRSRIARIEHGIGQSYGTGHPSYAGGLDCSDVGLFLMPNRYSADRWQAVYPEAEVHVIGSPRLDALPGRGPGPAPTVAISFHWNLSIYPETRTSWAHYKSALAPLAAAYPVLGHGHPRILDQLRGAYRQLGIEVVTDFDEVCRRADLYVCDNSSTLYEFAATGRPVVVLNAPKYRRGVELGLRFWEAADVGIQVDGPEECLDAVQLALADSPARQAAREAALALVYAHRSGAAQRAAGRLVAWAGRQLPEEVAAAAAFGSYLP